jgi:lysozyme
MISRRATFAGMAGLAAAALGGCASQQSNPRTLANNHRPPAAATPMQAGKLDAVIDMSHLVEVTDFGLVRHSGNILAVVHKASEGGDWVDPLYAVRRPEAQSAGLLWGAYHYGTHQYSGEEQARTFLAAAQPGPETIIALDFEPNDRHPSNTMRLAQAEAFVRTVYATTGRLPLVYIHPSWANGERHGSAGLSLGQPIGPESILARCELWLADYREEPEIPMAWADRGWRLWQYAGDQTPADAAYGSASRCVAGVDHCDRNLFAGDAVGLYSFWNARTFGA